jgi:CheY-like chemotaxis protein
MAWHSFFIQFIYMNTLHNVLLADDDADDRMLFRDIMNDLGLRLLLDTVSDGVELMEFLRTAKKLPDALFLDVNMPKKDGLTCLREIKADPALQSIPVVIFSNTDNTMLVEMMLNEGAAYFVRKQHGYNKMLKLINKLFSLDKQMLTQKKELHEFVIT